MRKISKQSTGNRAQHQKGLSRENLEAVIFDMDGVMVDSEHQFKLAGRPYLERLLPGWKEDFYEEAVGLGVSDFYDFLTQKHGLTQTREEFDAVCELIAEDVYKKRVTRTDGLVELLGELKANRIKIGLASSSPKRWIQMVLDRFLLHDSFHCVVSVDDVGGKGKPLPDIYISALAQLGAQPKSTVAIEDSAFGLTAAKRAGIACIGFRNGTNLKQDLAKADLEVSNFRQLSYGRIRELLQ